MTRVDLADSSDCCLLDGMMLPAASLTVFDNLLATAVPSSAAPDSISPQLLSPLPPLTDARQRSCCGRAAASLQGCAEWRSSKVLQCRLPRCSSLPGCILQRLGTGAASLDACCMCQAAMQRCKQLQRRLQMYTGCECRVHQRFCKRKVDTSSNGWHVLHSVEVQLPEAPPELRCTFAMSQIDSEATNSVDAHRAQRSY